MKKHQIPLEEGRFYHVYNRGNNGDLLFYKPENYRFFLRRLEEYLSPYVDIFAFCLLPNHFHLLVQVREREEALHPGKEGEKALHFKNAKLLSGGASKAFHRLFTSYSKAINKQEGRHGSLFENPFKRKEITTTQYLVNVVCYIHANPQLHGIAPNFRDYPWSSYNRILTGKPSKLQKEQVLEWFSNAANYIACHSKVIEPDDLKDIIIE